MEACQPQVRDDLRGVNRRQTLDAFQLHEHSIVDDDIGAITGIDAHTLIDQRNKSLAYRAETTEAQLVTQALPIRRLE